MNLAQAVFDILFIFSTVDGMIDDKEIELIDDFLENCADNNFDLNEEVAELDNMKFEEKLKLFADAAEYIKHLPLEKKTEIIELAFRLIHADGQISGNEAELFTLLRNYWEIDTEQYLFDKDFPSSR